MRKQLITLGSGILCGLIAATLSFGEVGNLALYEDFEGDCECWNDSQRAQALLESNGDCSTCFCGPEPAAYCDVKLESWEEEVPVGPGTTLQFDAYMPETTTGAWALIGVAQECDPGYNASEFHCGIYISAFTQSAYVLTGGSHRQVDFPRGEWTTVRAEVDRDGYVQVYIHGVRAGRTVEPVAGEDVEGPVVLAASGMKLDNVIVAVDREDTAFSEDFEEGFENWYTNLGGSEAGSLVSTPGSTGNAFYTDAANPSDAMIMTKRTFQFTSNLDISFDAKVPEGAQVIVGFGESFGTAEDPQGELAIVFGLNGNGSIGWYTEGNGYEQIPGLDGRWHTYMLKVIYPDILVMYQDGQVLEMIEINSDCLDNLAFGVIAEHAYVDNIVIE